MVKAFTFGLCLVAAGVVATGVALADVPPNIEGELVRIGKIVDPACTAKLYRPLLPATDVTSNETPLYPGIAIARDVSFGPHPKDVVDIFSAEQGPEARPVLIYIPGGSGEKIELQVKESHAFYDNIARWATRNGMVGVNMQRHAGQGWDDGARDIAKMIQFVQSNAARYHGDPKRIFIWAHSAGNVPLGTYLGRPELWPHGGSGLRGAILMSAASFNILPLQAEMGSPADRAKMFALAGKTCGAPGPASTEAALPGRAPGQPGGPGAAPPGASGGPPPAPPAVDHATQLARSSLPVLKTSPLKILLANGELDVGTDPATGNLMPFNKVLHDELCKAGPAHCPTLLVAKGHSHMSVVFSIDTPDTSVSGPILAWIKAN